MPPKGKTAGKKATAAGGSANGSSKSASSRGNSPVNERRGSSAATKTAKARNSAEVDDSEGESDGFQDAEGGEGEAAEGQEEEESAEKMHDDGDKGQADEKTESMKDVPETENKTEATPAADPKAAIPEPSSTTSNPPPPPPRPALNTQQVDAAPTEASKEGLEHRRQSSGSLWDRLRTPAEKAAAEAAAQEQQSAAATTTPTGPSRSNTVPLQSQPITASNSRLGNYKASDLLTSAANYAATAAASRGFQLPERLGGGAAAAASLAPPPPERKRLPRYEVDEAKMMEDQMRFAEARHVLATSKSLEEIRALGKEVESAYRSKLAELTELHVKLEDTTASISDIEDENIHLRAQMAQLSEQIALREEDFQAFQTLTVAHQERERELWNAEIREEKERLEWREREAVRILAEERAINAQLRLVLLGSLRDGATSSVAAGQSGTGLLSKDQSRLSVISPDEGRRSAFFDQSLEMDTSSPALERGSNTAGAGAMSSSSSTSTGARDRRSTLNASSGGGEEDVQDDVLFNLNLPHTASGSGAAAGAANTDSERGQLNGTAGGAPPAALASLFSDVIPVDQLKLLLKLDEYDETESAAQDLLHSESSTGGRPTSSTPATTAHSTSASRSMSQIAGPSSPPSASAQPQQYPTTLPGLTSTLLTAKSQSDYQLSQSLQLENLSLRAQFRDVEKAKKEAAEEIRVLTDKLKGMEEALDGLLQGGGATSTQ